ncbi:MAG: hypothetical protein HYZ25_18840 [Chloroflexi bacterium]|nr:hypothetical protein [Chloroflexota bacterium]
MTGTSITCPACGGPNEPLPGAARMACTFCGTNLNIPEELHIKATPKSTNTPKAKPVTASP